MRGGDRAEADAQGAGGLDPVETAKFLAVASTDSMHPYWALAIETGARTSELLGLGWADVDVERGTLTIGRRAVRLLKGTPILKEGAKTAAGRRTIRLTEGMLTALNEHHERQQARRGVAPDWVDNDLIFPTASGRPINPSHVRRAFDRLVEPGRGQAPHAPWDAQEPYHGAHRSRRQHQSGGRSCGPSRYHHDASHLHRPHAVDAG